MAQKAVLQFDMTQLRIALVTIEGQAGNLDV